MPRDPVREIKRDWCSPGVISGLVFCSGELCCDPAGAWAIQLISFPGDGCAGSPAPSSQVQWHHMQQLHFTVTW